MRFKDDPVVNPEVDPPGKLAALEMLKLLVPAEEAVMEPLLVIDIAEADPSVKGVALKGALNKAGDVSVTLKLFGVQLFPLGLVSVPKAAVVLLSEKSSLKPLVP